MTELLLYTTSHCHLCEKAESLLIALARLHPLHWQSIEIADDDTLLSIYGTRIPVVKIKGKSTELDWPFNEEAIKGFIE
jgi:hypothetical protein